MAIHAEGGDCQVVTASWQEGQLRTCCSKSICEVLQLSRESEELIPVQKMACCLDMTIACI